MLADITTMGQTHSAQIATTPASPATVLTMTIVYLVNPRISELPQFQVNVVLVFKDISKKLRIKAVLLVTELVSRAMVLMIMIVIAARILITVVPHRVVTNVPV